MTARTFAGAARFAGRCDAVTTKAAHFFHDVSWYGGLLVTPSNVSTMII